MRRVQIVGAATFAALLVGVLGTPVAAVPPTPVPKVALPAAIDLPAFYEKQTVCDPAAKPGATALGELLVTTYGPATIYIPRACTSSTSEHFDGRAVDWMRSVRVPAEKAMADAFVNWLLAPAADGTPHEMARRLGVMYIIWNNRMIRMYDVARGWTEYRDCLDAANAGTGLDTSCHRNHVHLSLSWDGAAGITSWWTGRAQTLPYCSARSTSASPGSGTPAVVTDLATVAGLVRVAPIPLLDTAAGSGAGLSSGCRVLAGRALFPGAAPPVVPDGVRWAAVQVTSTSNAPARLAAWSSGAARPSGQVSAPIGRTTATMLVPVASDRTIGLGTSLGAATLSASLVGYVPGEPTITDPPAPVVTTPPPAPDASAQRPSKPRAVKAKSARRAVTTRWKAPTSQGSAPITGYRVQALTSKKKGAAVAGTCTAGPSARSCTIKGLRKGKKYWMSVSVTNAAGSSWAARKSIRVR
jgi:hypothetical protein